MRTATRVFAKDGVTTAERKVRTLERELRRVKIER